uniref:Putative ovule protein n=1 Tax=Solanum chacoense TaxID=4108 RepID=A0A0V0IEI9_SOLCH
MRKLLTYWIIFSLFHHIFDKLIQWVPLWPYIKLITICWLVIRQFDGACYLYQKFIHPCLLVKLHDVITQFYGFCYAYQRFLYVCLSVNLQIVADRLNKPMEDPSLKKESFLTTAERYLEENGSDALLKLIANKCKDNNLNHHAEEIKTTDTSVEAGSLIPNQTLCEGARPVWQDIKPMEHMAKYEAAQPKQVRTVRENLIWSEKKTIGMQVKETEVPTKQTIQLNQEPAKHVAAAQSEHSNNEKLEETVHLAGVDQQENQKQLKNADIAVHNSKLWCPGEIAMAAHLDGMEHLAKHQLPMSSMAVADRYLEENGSDAQEKLITNKSKAERIQATDTCDKAGMLTPSQVKRLKGNLIWIAKNTADMQVKETTFPVQEKHGPNEKPKEKIELVATGPHEKLKQVMNSDGATHNSRLWCGFCNVRCSGEIDMAAHLNGRKHLGKVVILGPNFYPIGRT